MTRLATRTPPSDPATTENVARAVRSHIDVIRTSGSVWGTTERAVLHLFTGTQAEQLFGRSSLTAAARKSPPTCCAFGYARLLALTLGESRPTISPAMIALLGRPCARCTAE